MVTGSLRPRLFDAGSVMPAGRERLCRTPSVPLGGGCGRGPRVERGWDPSTAATSCGNGGRQRTPDAGGSALDPLSLTYPLAPSSGHLGLRGATIDLGVVRYLTGEEPHAREL